MFTYKTFLISYRTMTKVFLIVFCTIKEFIKFDDVSLGSFAKTVFIFWILQKYILHINNDDDAI